MAGDYGVPNSIVIPMYGVGKGAGDAMKFRYASVISAGLFLLIHGYYVAAHGLMLEFWLDIREVVELFTLVAIVAVLIGHSAWYVTAAMSLTVVWLYGLHPSNLEYIFLFTRGRWYYSLGDVLYFPFVISPGIALLLSIFADGRWNKIIEFLRRPVVSEDEA